MHRPQAVGPRAVMLGLLVALALPSAAAQAGRPTGHGPVRTPLHQRTADAYLLARTAKEAVKAGTTDKACTGWRSTLFPPPSIYVLQTRGPDKGKVYRDPADPTGATPLAIPFREYVEITMAAEFPAFYPQEVLKAGAIVVKQYSWYNTIVYRGGVDVDGLCYDVRDDTIDQWYEPEKRVPKPSQLKAIAATWATHLRKSKSDKPQGWFFRPGYRAGANVPCGSDADGFRIWQHSAYACGKSGMDMEQILRRYLEPRLEIVTPGQHDILGDGSGTLTSEMGDVSALVETGGGALVPHLWQMERSGIGTADASSIDLSGPDVLGFASDDANGDGWDDLVFARSTGQTSVRVSVARSDGTEYRGADSWWSGELQASPEGARLLVGDWNGDGRQDAGLLLRKPDRTAELRVLLRKKGNAYQSPVSWWTGPFDPETTRASAGDFDGDGRADLLLVTDLGAGGLRIDVAYSPATSKVAGLGGLKRRYVATDLAAGAVKITVGDVTRDGRDDVLLLRDSDTRTTIDVLKASRGNKAFRRTEAWRSTADGHLPFAKLRIAASDVDYDGLMDLVVFRDRGDEGTQILTFVTPERSAYGTLEPGESLSDGDVEWTGLRPY